MQPLSTWHLLQICNLRFKKNAIGLILGAFLFGSITGLFGIYIEKEHLSPVSTISASLGLQQNEIDEFVNNAKNGDIMAVQDFINTQNIDSLTAMSMLSSTLVPYIKILVLSMMFSLLVSFISSIYFTLFSSVQAISIPTALYKSLLYTPGMILVYIWTSLKSLGWIPIIGPIIAIILLPRYLFVPVTYILEKNSIIESVQRSYSGTKGYIGYISIVLTIISLLLVVVYFAAIILSSIVLDPYVGMYSPIIRGFISQLLLAYSMIALTIVWNKDL